MEKLKYERLISKENISILEESYNIQFTEIEQMFLGADRNTFVYKVSSSKGSVFLKIRTGYFDKFSVTIPYFLSQKIGKHIIEPLKTMQGDLFVTLKDETIILYPFIQGLSAIKKPMTKNQWIALGETLRKIHGLDFSLESEQIPRESFDASQAHSQRRILLKKYMKELHEKELKDEGTREFIALLDEKSEIIKTIADRAEELFSGIINSPHQYCLCHGDIHGGNIFITHGNNTENDFYIVDWDTLIMAPKERDLMFIGGGVANIWNKPEEVSWFYEGYGEAEINQNLIDYYRCQRILEDIIEYYEQFFAEPKNGKNQKTIVQRVASGFYPGGVADAALGN